MYTANLIEKSERCKFCKHLGDREMGAGKHECWHHIGLIVRDNARACPQFHYKWDKGMC